MRYQRANLLASAGLVATLVGAQPALAQEAAPAAGAPAAGAPAAEAPAAEAPAEAATNSAGSGLDIVVTARRRQERMQDVPIAVTVLSPQAIEAKGTFTPLNLAETTPGLHVATAVADRNNVFYNIRGQGFLTGGVFPAVITYINEVPNQYLTEGSFFDLENIQILRGPQGVDFGRVTDGGNVMISTQKPKNEFGGYVGAKLGDYSLRTLNGAINIPLVEDKVLFRGAFETARRRGFTHNLATDKYLDDTHYDSYRGSLTLRPVDAIENLTVVSYTKSHTNGTGVIFSGLNAPAALRTLGVLDNLGFVVTPGYGIDPRGNVLPFVPGLTPLTAASYVASQQQQLAAQQARGIREVDQDDPSYSRRKLLYISNRTSVNLTDTIQLTNILGFNHEIVDVVGLFVPSNGSFVNLCHTACGGPNFQDVEQISEELRLSGTSFDKRLTWSLGGYLDRQKDGGTRANRRIFAGVLYQDTLNERETKERAVYGRLEFALTDQLRLNAGLRYTHDTIDQSSGAFISLVESPAARTALLNFYTGTLGLDPATAAAGVAATFAPIPATCADAPSAVGSLLNAPGTPDQRCTDLSASFKPWTYTFGADYKPAPGKLIYVKYSKGYRPGGVNELAVFGVEPKYSPETDYSAEVGIKADWHFGDVFLRTNLTGFWDKYKDIQKLIIPPASTTVATIISNVDDARIRGIEAEVTLVPVHGLTFNGTFGYIDAKYRGTGPAVSLSACDPNAITVVGFCPFNKFNQTPKYSYSLAVDYLLPGIPSDYGEVHVGGALAGRSKMPLTDTSRLNPFAVSRAITTFDLTASWRDVLNQPVDLGFFVTNLTNEKYTVGSNDLSQSSSIGTRAEMWSAPRMWGFTFKYRFGSDAR